MENRACTCHWTVSGQMAVVWVADPLCPARPHDRVMLVEEMMEHE